MTDVELVLSRDQRDEIMKAVKAIERQVQEMVGKPYDRLPTLPAFGKEVFSAENREG
jgi:hypothetical protein